MTKWFVSRQKYWHSGDCVVEIAAGGLEYSNPDMLSDLPDHTYGKLGDMLETMDPREALAAAIAIRDEWRQHTDEPVRIETGFTHGCTIPFEEEPTDEQLHKWAEKAWENTLKCDSCGDALPEKDYYIVPEWGDDLRYCQEYCADSAYQTAQKEVHLL